MMTAAVLPAIASEKSKEPSVPDVYTSGTHPAKDGRVLSVVFCFLGRRMPDLVHKTRSNTFTIGNKKASGSRCPEALK